MDNEIKSLQDKGAIHQASLSDPGFVSSLFMVPKKGGGQRPVIKQFCRVLPLQNGRDTHVKRPFKERRLYGKIRPQGCILHSSGVDQSPKIPEHNVGVCLPSFWPSQCSQGVHQNYETCYRHVAQNGSKINSLYLDDILIMAESKQLATQHAQLVASTLENLGFVVNYEKSVLTPSLQMEFLGFLVDSKTLTLALPHEKVRKIQRECQKALTVPSLTLRKLASLIGLLNSSIQAVFPAPLHYRHLQNLKNQQLCHSMSYESEVLLSPQAREELSW